MNKVANWLEKNIHKIDTTHLCVSQRQDKNKLKKCGRINSNKSQEYYERQKMIEFLVEKADKMM